MGEHNSPYFAAGCADGERDTQLRTSHPGGSEIGPQPPDPNYPVMYMRGYERTFDPTAYHELCPMCDEEMAKVT